MGPDVTGVTIHSGGASAEAWVANGTYAAWWPGRAFDNSAPAQPSGKAGPELAVTYDLTLRDGIAVPNAQPTHR